VQLHTSWLQPMCSNRRVACYEIVLSINESHAPTYCMLNVAPDRPLDIKVMYSGWATVPAMEQSAHSCCCSKILVTCMLVFYHMKANVVYNRFPTAFSYFSFQLNCFSAVLCVSHIVLSMPMTKELMELHWQTTLAIGVRAFCENLSTQ
jgi:hypothetical protein